MNKTNKLARECILFSMVEVKDNITTFCNIGNTEKIEQLSIVMKILAEAYKNIK